MIARRTVACLAVSQLVCWGVSYYLIGVFGERIGAELGWSRALVFGGFSAALVVMGLVSPAVGTLIDRFGGGRVMAMGSLLSACGCLWLSLAQDLVGYYGAWICLGLAMRATLYEAAFAALARIGGPLAQRPIAQVTLLGGLASSCFWPLGHLLAESFGWRGALLCYAAFALFTLPLHLAIPSRRHDAAEAAEPAVPSEPVVSGRNGHIQIALLYAVIMSLTSALSSAMSAHMIGLLSELGLAAALAVSVSALRGIGQSLARLAEVLFGGRLHPVTLNLLATLALPCCFVIGLAGGGHLSAAAVFAFVYGAGNGIITIAGGTMPLILFDIRTYGAIVGWLRVPSFLLSAMAPFAFAALLEDFGAEAVLYLSIFLSLVTLAAAVALRTLVIRPQRSA
ncbi:MFS transporter [Pelagibius sp.]|uniref:MFS transporter n=1 Tax=Pelagibius sp. TaxID=1931238 RepID=UPI00261AC9F8|nr:MFS transporter [Pelagibius sp.]